MGLEAVKEIQLAEEECNRRVKEAQQQAKDMIKNAHLQGDEKYREIIEGALQEAQGMIQKEIDRANGKLVPLQADGLSVMTNLVNQAETRMDMAVNLIVERIVNGNGNR